MVGQYKDQFDGIMRREVSRVEFLKYIGVALLGLVGFIGFLKNLHEVVPDHSANNQSAGYGRSPYGR